METNIKFVRRNNADLEIVVWDGSNSFTIPVDDSCLAEIASAINMVRCTRIGSATVVLQRNTCEHGVQLNRFCPDCHNSKKSTENDNCIHGVHVGSDCKMCKLDFCEHRYPPGYCGFCKNV